MNYDERVGPDNRAINLAFVFFIGAIVLGALITSC